VVPRDGWHWKNGVFVDQASRRHGSADRGNVVRNVQLMLLGSTHRRHLIKYYKLLQNWQRPFTVEIYSLISLSCLLLRTQIIGPFCPSQSRYCRLQPASSPRELVCHVGSHIVICYPVAEWLACWTQAQKGPGSNRSRDAVG